MRRGEHLAALMDVDFLLGVSDNTRQGALRFRSLGETDFLGEPSKVPHLISLPELLRASDELISEDDPVEAIKHLLDTGSTGLGGARPKASVLLEDGSLAIVKFPHGSDRWDVMAWEATMLDLQEKAGIVVPQRRLIRVGRRNVLVVRRFDRGKDGARIGYMSAMTATESSDGDQRDYADIAEAMRDISSSVKKDHRSLYRRVIANAALGNTDDHLRNHGFIAVGGGWELSPVFDVNPNPDIHNRRATSVVGTDTFPDEVEAVLDLAEECGMRLEGAKRELLRIADSFADWETLARNNGIAQREILMMADSIRPRLGAIAAIGDR